MAGSVSIVPEEQQIALPVHLRSSAATVLVSRKIPELDINAFAIK